MESVEEQIPKMEVLLVAKEEDELESKETVLQRYFLLEWKLVKSLLDDIVSNGCCVSDLSSAHKIRSNVAALVMEGGRYLRFLFMLLVRERVDWV